MKNPRIITLIICFATLSLSSLVHAQRFNGGLMAGLNASQIDGDHLSGYHKAGLVIGPHVSTQLNDRFTGHLEIRYSSKGSATPKDYPYIQKIRLQYVEVPVLAGMKFFRGFRGQAGISIGYLFKAEAYQNGWGEFADPPSAIDMSGLVGVNYQLLKHISVNARLGYSLFPIHSEDTPAGGNS
ncbi:MAG: PorT family protein, partial [Bacteroidales bacterium]|nr:PorT family protein [Bacteroidales bacterium]